jgi:hypothetical protein
MLHFRFSSVLQTVVVPVPADAFTSQYRRAIAEAFAGTVVGSFVPNLPPLHFLHQIHARIWGILYRLPLSLSF